MQTREDGRTSIQYFSDVDAQDLGTLAEALKKPGDVAGGKFCALAYVHFVF